MDPCETFARMLKSRGYQVEPNHQLSLSALRNLPGQDIGFLYIGSHANSHGYFGLGTEEFLGITSAEIKLRNEEVEAELVKGMPYDRVGKNGVVSEVAGYSARVRFFNKYWRDEKGKPKKIFSESSLVIISACDVQDNNFINLLHGCGAGTILAWNENVAPNVAALTANYILDRLLGTNMQDPEFKPEKLRRRPLLWGEVLQDMMNQQSLAGTPLGGPFDSFLTGKKASLLAYCRPDCAGPFLAPNIIFLNVDEFQKRLLISGRFGPDQGEAKRAVIISENPDMTGSKKLQVKTWKESEITCDLEPDTAGFVVVNVDGRPSNCIPLTEWKGQIMAVATGEGTLKETCVLNFSMRTDGHLYRTAFTIPLNGVSAQTKIVNGRPVPGHESPAEVLAAYEASYLFINVPISAIVSSVSTLQYEASGSVNYNPPKGNLLSKSLNRKGIIPSVSSEPKGILKVGFDCFNLTLTITRNHKISNTASLPFDEVYDVVLLLDTTWGSSKYQVSRTTTFKDGQPKKENVPVYLLGSILTSKLLDLKNESSFDLPDPNKNKPPDPGADFKTATFNISAKVRFAPELSKGEDYFI